MVRPRPRSPRPTSKSAYARLVGQLFSVTGSLEQAEDVVQEAFIRALDRWPRIQAHDVPELWMRRVAINLAVSEIRRMRRRAAALLRLGAQRPQQQQHGALVHRHPAQHLGDTHRLRRELGPVPPRPTLSTVFAIWSRRAPGPHGNRRSLICGAVPGVAVRSARPRRSRLRPWR
ncbi:sigma factor [Streptomyces mirabilis]|uniref:sigma factor n=1 Tax=Streptomyces mirabilis TaxID=68239 RepID=UPI0033EB3CE9